MDYFIEKIESIRQSTSGSKASTRLPAATSTLCSFEEYSTEDIQKTIEFSPTKSCSVDPVPTSILKEFLPELLPFITMMCNRSLQEGILPPSQKHAVIILSSRRRVQIHWMPEAIDLCRICPICRSWWKRWSVVDCSLPGGRKTSAKVPIRVSCSPFHRNCYLKGSVRYIDSGRPGEVSIFGLLDM